MSFETGLTRKLGLAHPIIQAPMAGGGDTPDLVAAVSEAGGMGFIGAAYLSPRQIAEATAAVRARTERPFGINLVAPLPVPEAPADPGPAVERVTPFYTELDLQRPVAPARPADPFADLLPAVLESGASVFSFTFGIPPGDALAALRGRGMLLAGTATTVDEARALDDAGIDAVVAQGSEAGGHRGTFAGEFEMAMVGTMALVPQVADAVSVPVIASGGIMDGRGIAAALALGADAVQMGTAFLTCAEAGVADAYKDAIVAAGAHQTRLTRAFSGRPARGIVNRFMTDIDEAGAVLPFPYQNALTRPMRRAAAEQGRAEFLSLWAGQGAALAARQPAAELVARLAEEAGAVIGRLAGSA